MVRDESREANEEVAELRRLLEEAEARREVVRTGQGALTWWSVLYAQFMWLLWGETLQPGESGEEDAAFRLVEARARVAEGAHIAAAKSIRSIAQILKPYVDLRVPAAS